METFLEKRKYPRIDKRMSFKLDTGGAILTAETINLSCSGVYCRVNQLIPLMTTLRIVFALICGNEENDVEYVECEGIVVRVEEISPEEGICHIAIFFNDIEDDEKDKIMNFIEKHMNSDGG